MVTEHASARANVYVDGFNRYHGCFDDLADRAHWRPYRWLDLEALGRILCTGYTLNRIRCFTALVDDLPPFNPDNQARQLLYWRALRTIPHLTIHEGHFATHTKLRLLADRNAPKPTALTPPQKVHIIEREEKGSDVNLASYVLLDAFKADCELAVVISNDSDLAEPIRLVQSEFGLRVRIVNPRKRLARRLSGIANDYSNIRFEMIKRSQFPPAMTDATDTFRKPPRWS